jgi:micrococcal nuclease
VRPALPAIPLTVACIVVIAPACADREPRPPASTAVEVNATVVDVVDGDTVELRVGGRAERVRLIGIDTPETVAPGRPVECFGPEASAFLRTLLPAGSPVRLERDVEARDAYDRLLGYVYRGVDGLFVNLELAAKGYADRLDIPPNTTYRDEIAQAVGAARAAGTGRWGACGEPTGSG